MTWQVQQAKQRFSELVDKALSDGPQIVTRHGEEVAVVISAEDYRRLVSRKQSFKDFLRSGPRFDALARELERRRDSPRTVDLE